MKKLMMTTVLLLSTSLTFAQSETCLKVAQKFATALDFAQSYAYPKATQIVQVENSDVQGFQITQIGKHQLNGKENYKTYFCLTLENDSALKCAYVNLINNSEKPCSH